MGTVLEHPTSLFQGRLICHGPGLGVKSWVYARACLVIVF